jgi:hypothetical protein
MDSPSPPPAPDPAATASTQFQYNADAARLNTQLNRPTQITPYGTLKWSQGPSTRTFDQTAWDAANKAVGQAGQGYFSDRGDGNWVATGGGGTGAVNLDRNDPRFWKDAPSDQWTSEIVLDPKVKALVDASLDTSLGLQGSIKNALGRVDTMMGQPLDFSADSLSADRQRVEDSLYDSYKRRLDPQFADRENQLRSDLINRGFMEGTEAYDRELARLGRDRTDAYGQATRDSVLAGGSEQDRQIANQLRGRNQLINELASLRTGSQAPMPQFSSGMAGASVAPGNFAGAQQQQYQGQLAGYNAGVASDNALMGGLFSLGGAALGGPAGAGFGSFLGGLFG